MRAQAKCFFGWCGVCVVWCGGGGGGWVCGVAWANELWALPLVGARVDLYAVSILVLVLK